MIESSLGIVGACLPLLRPILTDTRVKSIFSSLRTILSRSSSLSNSANVKAMEYAKMEARGFRTPQVHTIENVDMVWVVELEAMNRLWWAINRRLIIQLLWKHDRRVDGHVRAMRSKSYLRRQFNIPKLIVSKRECVCDQSASCNKSTNFKYPHLLSLQPIYSGQYANIIPSCHIHGRWPVQQCQQEVQPSDLFHPKAPKSEKLSLGLASLSCERRKGYAQRVPSFSWIRLPTNIVHVFSLWNRSLSSENRRWDPRITWPLHHLISFTKEKLTITLVPFCHLITP